MSPLNNAIRGAAPFLAPGAHKRKQFDNDNSNNNNNMPQQRPPASRSFSASNKNIIPIVDVMEVNGRWEEQYDEPMSTLTPAPVPTQAGPSGSGSGNRAGRKTSRPST